MNQAVWTTNLNAVPKAVGWGRESGLVWVTDDQHQLTLLNRTGTVQSRRSHPGLVRATAADDGSAVVVACGQRISWLSPDLTPRWEHDLAGPIHAVALDPLATQVAVSSERGKVQFFSPTGQCLRETVGPVAFHHLAFVPERCLLVAAAEVGLVTVFDWTLNFWTWQDRPVANVGALAVNGSGTVTAVACFSEGLRTYDEVGKLQLPWLGTLPCRLVALGYVGNIVASVSVEGIVQVTPRNATPKWSLRPTVPVSALALAPLADQVLLAHTDGQVAVYALPT